MSGGASNPKWWGATALMIAGAFFAARAVLHWSDPPIQDLKWYYGTSRQITDLASGIVFAAAGLFVYRTGRWPR